MRPALIVVIFEPNIIRVKKVNSLERKTAKTNFRLGNANSYGEGLSRSEQI
jgi:hypothetical protein